MKKLLLWTGGIIIVLCGIYLWANSISKKERLELLNGEYELVDWQIRPKSAIHADSLTVHDVLQRGERLTLQTNDNGDFRLTTESSLPVLQQLADLEWQLLYVQRMAASCHGAISCGRTFGRCLLASGTYQSKGCRHCFTTTRPDK